MKDAATRVRPRVVLGTACIIVLAISGIATVYYWGEFAKPKPALLPPPPNLGYSLQTGIGPQQFASADYDLLMRDMQGHRVHFNQYKGKVVILNIWRTKCSPCRAEMPSLDNLHRILKGLSGISILCLCDDDGMEQVHEEMDLNVPFFRRVGPLPNCFATHSFPVTFIIDKQGIITYSHWGAAQWDDAAVVAYLQKLAEP